MSEVRYLVPSLSYFVLFGALFAAHSVTPTVASFAESFLADFKELFVALYFQLSIVHSVDILLFSFSAQFLLAFKVLSQCFFLCFFVLSVIPSCTFYCVLVNGFVRRFISVCSSLWFQSCDLSLLLSQFLFHFTYSFPSCSFSRF